MSHLLLGLWYNIVLTHSSASLPGAFCRSFLFFVRPEHIVPTQLLLHVLQNTIYKYIWILIYTKILEVNLFAFAYRLFHEDFSSIDAQIFMKQSVGKCKQINF